MGKTTGILLDIASEQNGYAIGKPWRFHEFSLTAIIPILRDSLIARSYQLVSEAGNLVRIKDSGSIDVMEITNNSETPILIKSGEVVVGATQSRVIAASQVIFPAERVEVPCCCVYSSKGIRQGQAVKVDSYAPLEVRSNLYAGYAPNNKRSTSNRIPGSSFSYDMSMQHNVWASVNDVSKSEVTRSARRTGVARNLTASYAVSSPERVMFAAMASENTTYRASQDDLAGRIQENEEKLKEVIKKIPETVNQVGLALVTMSGLESFESFDHKDSWSALRKSILKAEAGKIADLSDQDALFEFKTERAKEIIKALLTAKYEENVVVSKANTQITILLGDKFQGELVMLNDLPIHCSFVKK